MKERLRIIKVGGKVIDEEPLLETFLKDFSQIEGKKLLVHGGGKIASSVSEKLGIRPNMINGRRITDKGSLDVALMVYGGLINKKIVARLQALGVNALGLAGADLNVVKAHKRPVDPIDFGFVGDVDEVNQQTLSLLLNNGITPVMASLSHDGAGQMLNTNADTIAAVAAVSLSAAFEVELFYCFEKNGVLKDQNDNNSVIPGISAGDFAHLKATGVVSDGMLPKLENSFDCINKGVEKVVICHFGALNQLRDSEFPGTVLRG